MKNPVTHSVAEARNLQKKRQKRNMFLVLLLLAALLTTILILYVTREKKEIDSIFPPLESTSTSTFVSEIVQESTDEDPLDTYTDSSEAESDPTGLSDPTQETDTAEPNIYIPEQLSPQKITYQQRDSLYYALQNNIAKLFSTDSSGSTPTPGGGSSEDSNENRIRASVYYLNLDKKESFGIDSRYPFVPAGVMNFPICFDLFTRAEEKIVDLSEKITLTEEDTAIGSEYFTEEDIGEGFTLRELSRISLIENDNVATEILLKRLGGIESVNNRFKSTSNLVDFCSISQYDDYAEVTQAGTGRISTQDLALYMQLFYRKYLLTQSVYQPLFNDLMSSSTDWGTTTGLDPEQLHGEKTGVNMLYNSYASLSLVFAEEPYILCLIVEGDNEETIKTIHREAGILVAEYINSCYTDMPPTPTPTPIP